MKNLLKKLHTEWNKSMTKKLFLSLKTYLRATKEERQEVIRSIKSVMGLF